jgi:hypothetical protein
LWFRRFLKMLEIHVFDIIWFELQIRSDLLEIYLMELLPIQQNLLQKLINFTPILPLFLGCRDQRIQSWPLLLFNKHCTRQNTVYYQIFMLCCFFPSVDQQI